MRELSRTGLRNNYMWVRQDFRLAVFAGIQSLSKSSPLRPGPPSFRHRVSGIPSRAIGKLAGRVILFFASLDSGFRSRLRQGYGVARRGPGMTSAVGDFSNSIFGKPFPLPRPVASLVIDCTHRKTGCAVLPCVCLVCGIATHPAGVLAPYPALPHGVGSRLSGPGRVAIRSKRVPCPPQPAPPSPADTRFAIRVPLGTVRGLWVRFGGGG
jgi:hypothetical protein